MLQSYNALRTRIDRFAASVRARYSDQMVCRVGCAECCKAGLTMVMIEAVALGKAYGIEEERIHLQAGQPALSEEGRCALLGPDDLCTVYATRPLICLTHGLPLKYPDQEKIVYCEKNFISQIPHKSAVLDIANMETALFAVNLEYCRKTGMNPLARVAIDRLSLLISE
ncbi:MAG: YkgJ family cysteine cluster protein [Proteobacteria bacterium]|nr:YkgJ family cysteine cluster protein [Pseudomonadota bacterium]